ncbi:MAG: metallophosphoesterase [Bacteroidetes bacterium]|nr:metallophosphoesterase [Bacteroidota bacterium]
MRVLVLSDLFWNKNSIKIKLPKLGRNGLKEVLNKPIYERVNHYFEIVAKSKPDLVIFCGDVTGDGSCGHGYYSPFIFLVKLISEENIQVRYIAGDHDEHEYLEKVSNYFQKSEFVKKLEGKSEQIGNLSFLGLSFDQSKSKQKLTEISNSELSKLDIVYCHCPHSNRLRLLEIEADFILTGHFDLKVINPNGKTFISLCNDSFLSTNYVVIDVKEEKSIIEFHYIDRFDSSWFRVEKRHGLFTSLETNFVTRPHPLRGRWPEISVDKFEDSMEVNSLKKYLFNQEFQLAIEKLQKLKKLGIKMNDSEVEDMLNVKINATLRISKSFINSR